jgi:hypothetical protein
MERMVTIGMENRVWSMGYDKYSGCAVLGMRQTGSRKKWLDMDSGSKNTFYYVRGCWNIAGRLHRGNS